MYGTIGQQQFGQVRPEIVRAAEETVTNLKQLEGRIEVLKNDLAMLCNVLGHPQAAALAITPVQQLAVQAPWLLGNVGTFGTQGLGSQVPFLGAGVGLGSQVPFGVGGLGQGYGAHVPFGVGGLGQGLGSQVPYGLGQGISPYVGTQGLSTPWSPFLR
jgi:hypothetical protein